MARLWRERGDVVTPVTRSRERAAQWNREGFESLVADIRRPKTLVDLPAVDTILFAVGYDRSSGGSIYDVYVDGFRNLLDALPRASGPVIYTSSTGVYAQGDGIWVDEDSACEPRREGGKACLAAEKMLLGHPRGRDAKILRLAGLYGPGRIPRSADVIAGRPLPVTNEDYLNLIHVDDAARAVLAAAAVHSEVARTYTVSDGAPTTRREFFTELARLLKAPLPRFEIAEGWSERRSSTNKRIRNDRMIKELGIRPMYTTSREGLAAIFSGAPPSESTGD